LEHFIISRFERLPVEGQRILKTASVIGFATVATNLMHMLNPAPPPKAWLREHVKGIVGVHDLLIWIG
jgi:predicted ATPase